MTLLADTHWIVDQAKTLGFDLCGVVRAEKFAELEQMSEWLARGYAGEMKDLMDPRRSDPQTAMPDIHSHIVRQDKRNDARTLPTQPAWAIERRTPRPGGYRCRWA